MYWTLCMFVCVSEWVALVHMSACINVQNKCPIVKSHLISRWLWMRELYIKCYEARLSEHILPTLLNTKGLRLPYLKMLLNFKDYISSLQRQNHVNQKFTFHVPVDVFILETKSCKHAWKWSGWPCTEISFPNICLLGHMMHSV